jgi:hypothetical protein
MLECSSSWKQLYLAALKISEEDQLTQLVQSAELAMLHRLKELTNSPDHRDERNQIRLAHLDLLAVKTYKLRWPALPRAKSYFHRHNQVTHSAKPPNRAP